MKTVLVVEDVWETRQWIGDAVRKAFPQCELREVSDMRGGIHAAKGEPVDLAIVDLGLPDGSGIEVIAALHSHQRNAVVVVVTIMGDDASIISALSAGAHGYLLKDSPADLFARQLAQLNDGVAALSPSVAQRIIDHFRATAVARQPEVTLTPREVEVLTMVSTGLRNSAVAQALGVTEPTIASHIKSIYSKLGVTSRVEATLMAQRMGLKGS